MAMPQQKLKWQKLKRSHFEMWVTLENSAVVQLGFLSRVVTYTCLLDDHPDELQLRVVGQPIYTMDLPQLVTEFTSTVILHLGQLPGTGVIKHFIRSVLPYSQTYCQYCRIESYRVALPRGLVAEFILFKVIQLAGRGGPISEAIDIGAAFSGNLHEKVHSAHPAGRFDEHELFHTFLFLYLFINDR